MGDAGQRVQSFTCKVNQFWGFHGSYFMHSMLATVINTTLHTLVVQMVKNLPAMQEAWIQSLGQEDYLEKETATHSSILAWKIPRTEEPSRLQSMGSQVVEHN